MVGIDGTILNVALPTIATDLHTTSSELVSGAVAVADQVGGGPSSY